MHGQSWSMDLIIGVLVFTAIIVIFFTFLSSSRESDAKRLERDARSVLARLDADGRPAYPLVNKGEIQPDILAEIYNTNADDLRARFGTSSHFCIFVETEDGRLLPVSIDPSKPDVFTVGDEGINVSDQPCGARP